MVFNCGNITRSFLIRTGKICKIIYSFLIFENFMLIFIYIIFDLFYIFIQLSLLLFYIYAKCYSWYGLKLLLKKKVAKNTKNMKNIYNLISEMVRIRKRLISFKNNHIKLLFVIKLGLYILDHHSITVLIYNEIIEQDKEVLSYILTIFNHFF